jgi:hypothetical protein
MAKFDSLLNVLKRVRQWRPGIQFWELELQRLYVSSFRPLQEPSAERHWDIDELIETVEADYAKATPEEQAALDRPRYWFGWTGDGLISIIVLDPFEEGSRGVVPQFIEIRGTPLRKMSGNYSMGDGLAPKKCRYCGDMKDPAGMVLGPVVEDKPQTRFCDEFCMDLWNREKAQKKIPKLKSGRKWKIPPGHADRGYHGGYTT